MKKDKRAMVQVIIALIIGIIAMVAVAIPITQSVVGNTTGKDGNNSLFGSITATILNYLVTFVALAALALIAGMIGFKFHGN